MNFREYAAARRLEDFSESFNSADILAYKPEDGYWEPPLSENMSSHTYYFNIPSDPDKNCGSFSGSEPCYQLMMDRHHGAISISFRHTNTQYADRFDQNQEMGGNAGMEIMMSVLHGIAEYIQTKKPEKIEWSGARKSRSGAINSEAREKVYRLWAIKNIMGLYIPTGGSEWVRADVYKEKNVPIGWPEFDPEKYKGKKGYESFMQLVESLKDEIRRRREEEDRRRQEAELAEKLADPRLNPNKVKVGDMVYQMLLRDFTGRKGKIVNIKYLRYDDALEGRIVYVKNLNQTNDDPTYYDDSDYLSRLLPADKPEVQERFQQYLQGKIKELKLNYEVEIGDRVSAGEWGAKTVGVLEQIYYDENKDAWMATVVTNAGKKPFPVQNLHKIMTKDQMISKSRSYYGYLPGDRLELGRGWKTGTVIDYEPDEESQNTAMRFHPDGSDPILVPSDQILNYRYEL